MEKWELENIINNLQIKLDYLTEKVDDNRYQPYGTDVKYEYGQRTRGTKSEIEAVRAQIAQYQHALDKIIEIEEHKNLEPQKEPTAYDIDKEKKEQEKEYKQEREKQRLETFKQIKETYKKRKGHGFRKLTDRLFGNGPKWENVKKYSQEELDFVLRTLSGDTIIGEKRNDRVKGSTELEKMKKIKKANWDNFTSVLNSKLKLKQQMEVESVGHRL